MNDTVQLILAAAVLAVSITAYCRSRYWARRADTAAKAAAGHAESAAASAGAAQDAADRASLDQ